MSDKILDTRPARELTSRECAKIIGSLLSGLAGMAKPEAIFAALDFYTSEQYQAQHDAIWRQFYDNAVKAGQVIPEDPT